MKPDETRPDEFEAKITALLLGELEAAEAAEVEAAIAANPDWGKLRDRLLRTIELVREATASEPGTAGAPATSQLSDKRRAELLKRFRVVALPEPGASRAPRSWWVPMAAAAGLVLLLSGLSMSVGSCNRTLGVRYAGTERYLVDQLGDADISALQTLGDSPQREDRQLGYRMQHLGRDGARLSLETAAAGESNLRPEASANAPAPAATAVRELPVLNYVPSTVPVDSVYRYRSTATALPQDLKRGLSEAGKPVERLERLAESAAEVERGVMRRYGRVEIPAPVTPAVPGAWVDFDNDGLTDFIVSNGRASEGRVAGSGMNEVKLHTALAGRVFVTNLAGNFGSLAMADGMAGGIASIGGLGGGGGFGGGAGGFVAGGGVVGGPEQPTAWYFDSEGRQAVADDLAGLVPLQDKGLAVGQPAFGVSADDSALARSSSLGGQEVAAADAGALKQEAESLGVPVLGDRPILGSELWSREELAAKPEIQTFEKFRPMASAVGPPPAHERRLVEDLALGEVVEPEVRQKVVAVPEPQPEVLAAEQPVSTFSLNVSDVSFKLAAASLEGGMLPEPATIRSEEFINAFDYRDPEPAPGEAVALTWERGRYPFAHNRELLRFSVRAAAQGRALERPLNLVLLLDSSGSMERADRVRIIREAMRVLAAQIQPQDKVSVVSFARTPRLWVDALPGNEAARLPELVGELTPEGGTNLEAALALAYETAARHFVAGGMNRVVLLTDGAANLGNVEPQSLQEQVESNRLKGIALDCFGIGWEGYNDDLLEVLSRHGDGRYGFVSTPEEAASGFADQLAGALRIAAANVKVQVEFNPARVTAYRQIGYAKHQLTEEQFRDNTVDAAEIAAAESGNALYLAQVEAQGQGPIGVVRARYQDPATGEYHEREWMLPYLGPAPVLEAAGISLRLAGAAAALAEWLAGSPFAGEVTPDRLLRLLDGVPEAFEPDPRPQQLRKMVVQGNALAGGSTN
ncbi:MAG: von Willebrand factor type A domain-containing protein [Verrucomicrobia bacterium]|nr:von Willebrand factor type A domain-containing protein [Verrucomicrobiota bacterium]